PGGSCGLAIHFERALEEWNKPNRPKWMAKPQEPPGVAGAALDKLVNFVEGRVAKLKAEERFRQFAWGKAPFGDWFAPPGVHLVHVVRLAYAFGQMETDSPHYGLWWSDTRDLEAYRGRCREPFGLRELDAAVAVLPGGQPGAIAAAYIAHNSA